MIKDVSERIIARRNAPAPVPLFAAVVPSCVKFLKTYRRKPLNFISTSTKSSPSNQRDWAICVRLPGSIWVTTWCPSCRTTPSSIWPNFPACKLSPFCGMCQKNKNKISVKPWRFLLFALLMTGSSAITNCSACKETPSPGYSLSAYCKSLFLFFFRVLFVFLAFGLIQIEL